LMLILLVENAFKHGVEKLRADARINIKLKANDDRIHFKISNNFDPEEVNETDIGIGLSNLRRRLEIGYQKDHELKIFKQATSFNVHLALYKT